MPEMTSEATSSRGVNRPLRPLAVAGGEAAPLNERNQP
jgi:hypothetical protein